MDGIAGGGADRGVPVAEEDGNVLGLVVAGDHELDAVACGEPAGVGDQRDPVVDGFADRNGLGVAARETGAPVRLASGSTSRRLARSHPPVMLVMVPSGAMSRSITIHAVSIAVLVADRCNSMSPATSRSAASGAVCQYRTEGGSRFAGPGRAGQPGAQAQRIPGAVPRLGSEDTVGA